MIDGLRGFSLFGILAANMLIFQYGMWGKDELSFFSPGKADLIVHDLIKILIEGSFMPIFMFLFGYSMIMMKDSLVRKGLKVKRHFVRRFLLLTVIGILHSVFLWEGDILLAYGLVGFFMLLFLNRKNKTLLIWGITVLVLFSAGGYGVLEETAEDKARMAEYIEQAIPIYQDGSYGDIKEHRNTAEDPLGLPDFVYLIILVFFPVMCCFMFLFGMYAANKRWFTNPETEKRMYLRYAAICIPAGLLMKAAAIYLDTKAWAGIGGILGPNILAIGYIFAFAGLYARNSKPRMLDYLESAGRLSLSIYLMQTVIFTTIFYGYGFGLYGKLGMIGGMLAVITVYMLQLEAARWYLKRFKTGPVEKVMKMFTYWRFREKSKKLKQAA